MYYNLTICDKVSIFNVKKNLNVIIYSMLLVVNIFICSLVCISITFKTIEVCKPNLLLFINMDKNNNVEAKVSSIMRRKLGKKRKAINYNFYNFF